MPIAEADDGADLGLLSPSWAGTEVALVTSDRAVLDAMLDVEVALVEAYVRLGLAPESVAATVRSVIASRTASPALSSSPAFDPGKLALRARGGGNPVIPLVTDLRKAVAAVDEGAALWIHRGATSQDILDTAILLVARRAVRVLLADARATIAGLVALAERHRTTITVSRTLTQHGVPTTFGLKAAGLLHGVAGAARRIGSVELPVQWGGAGGTLASFAVIGAAKADAGSGLGLDIAGAMALILGLDASDVPWQTQRAPVTRLGDALAELSDAMATVAQNVLLLVRPEIAELREPTASGRGGSSAMPQKHNPVLSVLIAAATRRVPGLAADLHRSASTVDERPPGAWHAEWSVLRELLRLVGGAAAMTAELASGLVVDEQAMRTTVDDAGPFIVSERLMLEFGPVIGRQRLQQIVSEALEGRVVLADALRAEPGMGAVSDERLAESLDPANYLGAADEIIDRVLRDAREGVAP